MFKNYLFVTPSCVHSIDHKRPERHLKMCWSQVSIAFTRYLWYWTAFFQCLAHNTKSDVMRMHNRVLLVILGTFLFTIAESNEIVSTIMYSKWIHVYIQELWCALKTFVYAKYQLCLCFCLSFTYTLLLVYKKGTSIRNTFTSFGLLIKSFWIFSFKNL